MLLALLGLNKALSVQVIGAAKPKKFSWKEFGEYLANDAALWARQDMATMRHRKNTELYTKFLNQTVGLSMLSTAFYLWSAHSTMSKILAKADEKDLDAFLDGYRSALSQLKSKDGKRVLYKEKHISFITNYFEFLRKQARFKQFDLGKTFTESVYKFYKIKRINDPILQEEKDHFAQHMMTRCADHNKSLHRRLSIKTLK